MSKIACVRMRAVASLTLCLLVLGALGFAGCGQTRPELTELPRPDPLWGEFLESHTTGIVSRTSGIRVVFATDVAEADRIGKDAGATLQIKPAIEGSVTFASTRELVFTPRRELAPAATYRVAVKPAGLKGVPETLPPFEFAVQVKRPDFEVSLGGLTMDSADDRAMLVQGVVATADIEPADKVARLLEATYAGKTVPIGWHHAADGLRHAFTIRGLHRAAQEQTLKVQWSGEPIGAAKKGERELQVPAQDRFVITQVTAAEEGGQRYIRVFFSDTLDRQQDFKGLVRLDRGNVSTRVDGNLLRVYSEQAIEGQATLTVERGVRNRFGHALDATAQYPVVFASTRPQVKFVGSGTILPEAQTLSVPFEAVGVRSVRVTALRIYDDNLTQFLQVNPLGGSYELGRVGRNLWRKTIPLTAADPMRWNRYSLDVTELLKKYPGGMVRLSLSIGREHSAYACEGAPQPSAEMPLADQDANDLAEQSNWDYVEEYYGVQDGSNWSDRDDPCKDAYYIYGQQTRAARNLLVSNIGLLAKKDQRGHWIVVASDLRTAQPLNGARISALNFQNQELGTYETDARGMAEFSLRAAPFMFVAKKGVEKAYLKVQQGVALPVSHFDVGGERVTGGIKGHIYGERGVWRPGDDIHLTFVLQDKDRTLPAQHPVTMELFNPQAQLVQTLVNTTPVNGFYAFVLQTAADAPTGNWTAKATLGGATFSRVLKIETVMPNRLKVALDLQRDAAGTLATAAPGCRQEAAACNEPPRIRGKLFGQWLSGATAAGLEADVKVRLTPTLTRFDRSADFVFADPAREFAGDPQTVFEGALDASGNAEIDKVLDAVRGAPGMLSAAFTSRIFERGGAFSISYGTHNFSPYRRYVGLKLPRGDVTRNMLRTDVQHTMELAGLTEAGQPTDIENVEVTLYKVEWKWWWDRSGDSLAQYAQRSHSSVVQQDTVSIAGGKGEWKFEIKYPAWGRYLVRVCDLDGGHCAGQTFYIDWPSWAGRAQDQSGPAASVLVFTADKDKYSVGETAILQLPQTKEGRALFTIENGTSILEARWIDFAKDSNRLSVPITQAMAPNVYASVTLIQPHGRSNDRPIRLYGVIPLHVTDPNTALAPVIDAAGEWRPNSAGTIEVSERNRRAMTYTLAVVDEGLLDLTSFRTPNLHEQFYKREALGVSTWDLFDEVAGAYSAEIERLLALGGSDVTVKNSDERRTRFPPVVRYLGPFELQAGEKKHHEVQLPQYIGAVRVMVVAGQRGAYGSAEKSVFVRQPLMLLPTLPRVLGPEEEVAVPVSVFVSDPAIKQVRLQIETDAAFRILGENSLELQFSQPEEQLGVLRLKSGARIGQGRVKFTAVSGEQRAEAEVYLDVRSPNPATTNRLHRTLEAGESWDQHLLPHGLPGTNVVALEVSAVPPLDLERRLHYLISYPYGCLEQVTSSVFPQLYLSSLLQLEDARKDEIQRNVQNGIHRLNGFQLPNGAFAYWPGGFYSAQMALRDNWSTTYAGHFLVEAKRIGYAVPESMLTNWARFQRAAAQAWSGSGHGETLDQAYRLYTLALAREPEVGAMNRLREQAHLPLAARWMLAASYQLAGLAEAANDLAKGLTLRPEAHAESDRIFGSPLRDGAIVLNSLVILGRADQAQSVAEELSRSLVSDGWHSTQSTAYALMAMAHYVGLGQFTSYTFNYSVDGKTANATVAAPMHSLPLQGFPDRGAQVRIDNTAQRRLFASLTTRGVPASGTDTASEEGLSLQVEYRDEDGKPIDVARLPQGSDLIARIVVANTTAHRIDNIALAQLLPAGWEIHNERMEGLEARGERDESNVQRRNGGWDGSPGARPANAEHVDIRDDRIYRYFSLKPQERLTFTTRLNAAYRGRYYLPSIAVEAMYDASRFARTRGQWVEVVEQGP